MTRAVPYIQHSIHNVDSWRLRALQPSELSSLAENLNGPLRPTSYTIVVDNTTVAVAGMIPNRLGTWEAWSVIDDLALDRPSVPRCVRANLWDFVENHSAYRVFATCPPKEYEKLSRWFRFLGLDHEGIVKAFGPNGADQHIFAWVRGVHHGD